MMDSGKETIEIGREFGASVTTILGPKKLVKLTLTYF